MGAHPAGSALPGDRRAPRRSQGCRSRGARRPPGQPLLRGDPELPEAGSQQEAAGRQAAPNFNAAGASAGRQASPRSPLKAQTEAGGEKNPKSMQLGCYPSLPKPDRQAQTRSEN